MNTVGTAVWGMALLALTFSHVSAAESLIPLERFAQGDAMSAPAMSPDGTRVVFMTHRGREPTVATLDLATQAVRSVLPAEAGNYVARWCRFKNDERILCSFSGFAFAAGRPFGTTRLIAVNADGSKLKVLVQKADGGGAQLQDRILHWLPDDPQNVVIQLDDDEDVYPGAFKLDVYSGKRRSVQGERRPIVSWMTDNAGVVRFGFGYRSVDAAAMYLTRASADAPWKVLEKFHLYDAGAFVPLGFGPRSNTLLIAAPKDGHTAAWEADLTGTQDARLLFSSPQADVERAITWPWDGRLLGFHYETDRPHASYIDERAQSIDATVRKLLPDRFSSILGGSRDGQRVLIGAYSDVKPEAFYVLDVATGTLDEIGGRNPDLAQTALAPMKTILVPLEHHRIPGFLTLPLDKEPQNLPLVVYPHGGPYARDRWGYDPVVQMLASRGYAVLQLNFRGSTGWGVAWLNAGWRGWGGAIHDDITSGARWAISKGIADPKRLCIVGWSYGGYAALLGAAREPDLYRCAASIGGVSDLNALADEARLFHGGAMSVRESIGADKSVLESHSPLKQADRIKVPVMLIHGDADFAVLSSHSETMAKALQKQGVPTQLLVIAGGGHSLDREHERLTLLRRLEAFLAANLGAN